MKRKTAVLAIAAAILAACELAAGDGMIVPVRPSARIRGEWSVKYHHVKMSVRDQVASVHIDQEFVNDSGGDMEVEYLFPVPPGAAMDSMTLVVDGRELTGKLMEAQEARRIYEDIVRRKKDPALLEYVGYGLYRTRAFPLQRGKPAHVITTYTTVCRRDHDLVEVFYPLNTEKYSARKIDDVEVTVDIKAKADITQVYSPTHDLNVQRKDARQVIVSYHVKDELPDVDFQVYYKASNDKIGATVLSHRPDKTQDGYFIVLVSPSPKTAAEHVASKDLVVVLDHSGSMAQNGKLDQAKQALRQVLGSLGEEDRFNVVTFCDAVDKLFAEMVDATRKNVEEAVDRLDRLEPTGGTNIVDAVTTAMGLFGKDHRPAYILFLTDGIPTVGERNEGKIVEAAGKANAHNVRLFALGVGYDVNVRLVDKLAQGNRGVSDYVKPKEPLEAKVSVLYNKIKRPVMTDVKVEFEDVRTQMTYPRELPDLFDGGEILWVGRYDDGGKTTLNVSGMLAGRKQSFEYPVVLAQISETNQNKFVERLWAARRVGFLLDEIQLHGESKEVVDELVKLSKTYGIMTPYTAFLADETVALGRPDDHRRRAGEAAANFVAKGGSGVYAQADAKARLELREAKRALPAGGPVPSMAGEARQGVAQVGWSDGRNYDRNEQERLANVQNVGNQTLFRRGQVWYAPGTEKLDLEKDKARIQTIQRFSEEYFQLVRQNSIDENRVLASQRADEELVIKLRGQFYLVK